MHEQLIQTDRVYRIQRTPQGVVCTVNDRPLPLRLDLWNHSPTGFEFGYGGSGPAQLALAILSDCCGDELAVAYRNLWPYVDEMVVCDPDHNALIARDGDKSDALDWRKLAALYRGGFIKRKDLADGDLRKEMIAKLPADELARYDVELLLERYDLAVKQTLEMKRRLIDLARKDPMVENFRAIPGMDWVRAATFLVFVDTPFRFKSKQKLWRYLVSAWSVTRAATAGNDCRRPGGAKGR